MQINKDWLTGFVDGEGCFYVGILKNVSSAIGYQVQLEFIITQHERDVQLLHAIRKYLDCGLVRKNKGKDDKVWAFRVRDFKSLGEKVIPFFEQNPLLTTKKYNYIKFKDVYNIMLAGDHLTEAGLNNIKAIKEKMNHGAAYSKDDLLS